MFAHHAAQALNYSVGLDPEQGGDGWGRRGYQTSFVRAPMRRAVLAAHMCAAGASRRSRGCRAEGKAQSAEATKGAMPASGAAHEGSGGAGAGACRTLLYMSTLCKQTNSPGFIYRLDFFLKEAAVHPRDERAPWGCWTVLCAVPPGNAISTSRGASSGTASLKQRYNFTAALGTAGVSNLLSATAAASPAPMQASSGSAQQCASRGRHQCGHRCREERGADWSAQRHFNHHHLRREHRPPCRPTNNQPMKRTQSTAGSNNKQALLAFWLWGQQQAERKGGLGNRQGVAFAAGNCSSSSGRQVNPPQVSKRADHMPCSQQGTTQLSSTQLSAGAGRRTCCPGCDTEQTPAPTVLHLFDGCQRQHSLMHLDTASYSPTNCL